MKQWKSALTGTAILALIGSVFYIAGLPLFGSVAHAEDGDAVRDHIKIEKTMPGGAQVTVVEGTDPAVPTAGETQAVAAAEPKASPPDEVTPALAKPAGAEPTAARVPAEMPAALAEPHKARLAVLPTVFSEHFHPVFKFSEKIESSGQLNLKMIFTAERESRMEAPSFTLSLTEAFVGSRKFDVLERARLNETLQEINFGESDYADVTKAVPMGKALNAEFVVLSEVEVIHLVTELKDIPYVDSVVPKLKGKMIARIRVVDVATTKVVAACREEVEVERKLKANDPFIDSEAMNLVMDLYQAESLRLLHRTLEAIYPVRLLNVEAGRVFLNRGEGAISVGDEFGVYSLGQDLVDPDTNEPLGSSETQVAMLKVTRIAPKFSEAEIVEGAEALKGDVGAFLCRETAKSIAAKTTVSPRALNW